jgi:hypothetical protein
MAEFIKLSPDAEPLADAHYVLVDGLKVVASVQTSRDEAAFVTSGPYPSKDQAMAAAKDLAAKHAIEKLYIREAPRA